jgi:hypothetical protein
MEKIIKGLNNDLLIMLGKTHHHYLKVKKMHIEKISILRTRLCKSMYRNT